MKVKAAAAATSKTNTSIGSRPAAKSTPVSGGSAKGASPDRSRTASEMSGNCGKLAAGPCAPKSGK